MKVHALLAAACFALSACGYDSPPPRGINEQVSASLTATDDRVIIVNVTDPLPVKAARLIAPNGTQTEAYAIDRDTQDYGGGGGLRPNVGVGVTGGSSGGVSTGIGIGFPIFSSNDNGPARRLTESRVRIRIPDTADYRLNWQRYAIAVDLDDGVNRRTFQMVPPAPK